LCTQCAARRGIEMQDVIDGIRIAGAASFVESALADDVQALVY
jgi:predicted peroxiredoxin